MIQGSQPATTLDDGIVATAEACLGSVGQAREAIHKVIFGQEQVVDLALVTILAGGHGLLVGLPGLAKQHDLTIFELSPSDESLESVFAYLVAR